MADVAVTARRDHGAESPWAFVVPQESVFGKDTKGNKNRDDVASSILKKANDQMAGYKKIEGLTWLEALPKRFVLSHVSLFQISLMLILTSSPDSDSGKILKKNLKVD